MSTDPEILGPDEFLPITKTVGEHRMGWDSPKIESQNPASSPFRESAKSMPSYKLPKADFPLVIVQWEDSAQPRPSWEWIDEYEPEPAILCISVGYLVSESADAIAVAPNLGDIGKPRAQASGIMRIPRCCIQSIKELKACRPYVAQYAEERRRQAPEFPS